MLNRDEDGKALPGGEQPRCHPSLAVMRKARSKSRAVLHLTVTLARIVTTSIVICAMEEAPREDQRLFTWLDFVQCTQEYQIFWFRFVYRDTCSRSAVFFSTTEMLERCCGKPG